MASSITPKLIVKTESPAPEAKQDDLLNVKHVKVACDRIRRRTDFDPKSLTTLEKKAVHAITGELPSSRRLNLTPLESVVHNYYFEVLGTRNLDKRINYLRTDEKWKAVMFRATTGTINRSSINLDPKIIDFIHATDLETSDPSVKLHKLNQFLKLHKELRVPKFLQLLVKSSEILAPRAFSTPPSSSSGASSSVSSSSSPRRSVSAPSSPVLKVQLSPTDSEDPKQAIKAKLLRDFHETHKDLFEEDGMFSL